MSSSTRLYLCNIPNYSSSAAWGTISRVVSNHDVTMLSAHVSQWDDRIIMIWPIREDPPCLLQCVSPWLGKVVLKTIRWWGCHITSLITTYNPEQLIFTDCLELTLSLTNLYIVIVLKGKINDLENFKCQTFRIKLHLVSGQKAQKSGEIVTSIQNAFSKNKTQGEDFLYQRESKNQNLNVSIPKKDMDILIYYNKNKVLN